MIFIKNIYFPSEDYLEAYLTISDGLFEFIVFKYPFEFEKIREAVKELTTIHSDKIYRVNTNVYEVKKLELFFAYEITGMVYNKAKGLIRVGEHIIELDNVLPGDIMEGEYVSFVCGRIDC